MHLRKIGNVPRQHLGSVRVQRQPFIQHAPCAGRNGLGNRLEQAGFAAAILPDDGNGLFPWNVQRHMLKHRFGAKGNGDILKAKVHYPSPPVSHVRSRYRKNGAPIKDRMMLTGISPGGMMTRPIVSQATTNVKPRKAEAGNRYL